MDLFMHISLWNSIRIQSNPGMVGFFLPDHQIITSLLLFVSGIFLVRVLSLYFKSFFDFPSITFFWWYYKTIIVESQPGDLMINVGMVCFWYGLSSRTSDHIISTGPFLKTGVSGVFNYWLVYLFSFSHDLYFQAVGDEFRDCYLILNISLPGMQKSLVAVSRYPYPGDRLIHFRSAFTAYHQAPRVDLISTTALQYPCTRRFDSGCIPVTLSRFRSYWF